jgi:hypothetical protein
MAPTQIHELPAVDTVTSEDRILISTRDGNLTRHALVNGISARIPGASAIDRRIVEKLGDAVSVKDFGALGDGISDDAPAFAAALAAHRSVFMPPGRYRLASTVDVLPLRSIIGAGRDESTLLAEGSLALVFRRNEGVFAIDQTATDDWNRSMLSNLSIRMAVGGIQSLSEKLVNDLSWLRGA